MRLLSFDRCCSILPLWHNQNGQTVTSQSIIIPIYLVWTRTWPRLDSRHLKSASLQGFHYVHERFLAVEIVVCFFDVQGIPQLPAWTCSALWVIFLFSHWNSWNECSRNPHILVNIFLTLFGIYHGVKRHLKLIKKFKSPKKSLLFPLLSSHIHVLIYSWAIWPSLIDICI